MSLNQKPLGVKNTLNVTTALSYDNGTTFLRKAGTDYSRKVFFSVIDLWYDGKVVSILES